MKYTITYEYDPKNEPYFFARSSIDNVELLRGGTSWERARQRMIVALTEHINNKVSAIPESEEVEL